MKIGVLKVIIILISFSGFSVSAQSRADSLRYGISINYLIDLSDTYGGGDILNGEFEISKSWYGVNLSFGYFLSQSDFVFRIPLEESGYVLGIPFEEMAIMKMGTASLIIIPIQRKRLATEILFGAAFAKAERSCFKGVEYSYDTIENRFLSLSKDYQLIRNRHFGYQFGISISFYPIKKAGLQINARMQDLSNGGSFFFVGGGICFKL